MNSDVEDTEVGGAEPDASDTSVVGGGRWVVASNEMDTEAGRAEPDASSTSVVGGGRRVV